MTVPPEVQKEINRFVEDAEFLLKHSFEMHVSRLVKTLGYEEAAHITTVSMHLIAATLLAGYLKTFIEEEHYQDMAIRVNEFALKILREGRVRFSLEPNQETTNG